MEPMPQELIPLVRRIVWREPHTSAAMEDSALFLQYAMAYGSDEDLALVRRHFTDEDLRAALSTAPPGLFDQQSWTYWHIVLGDRAVPPRPRRPFWPPDFEPDDRFSKCVPRPLRNGEPW